MINKYTLDPLFVVLEFRPGRSSQICIFIALEPMCTHLANIYDPEIDLRPDYPSICPIARNAVCFQIPNPSSSPKTQAASHMTQLNQP